MRSEHFEHGAVDGLGMLGRIRTLSATAAGRIGVLDPLGAAHHRPEVPTPTPQALYKMPWIVLTIKTQKNSGTVQRLCLPHDDGQGGGAGGRWRVSNQIYHQIAKHKSCDCAKREGVLPRA